ncbi:MAG: DUF5615 family PIN-like protein [Chloroflexia bacterium]|nr:DUF5615 family PIN-like protein [Chloroflexia bacterium]
MTAFLLDANLSPETARFLTATLDLDVSDLISRKLGHLSDIEVVALARREERVIITFDFHIAEMYRHHELGRFGVIRLRLTNQTVEAVNAVLARFFRDESASIPLDNSLVVVDERRVRVVTAPNV